MSPSGMPTGSVSSRPPEVKGSQQRGAVLDDVDHVEESSDSAAPGPVEGVDRVGTAGRGGSAGTGHGGDDRAGGDDQSDGASPATPAEPVTETGLDGPGGSGPTATTPAAGAAGPTGGPTAGQDPAETRIAELEAEIAALRSELARREDAREDLVERYESLLGRKHRSTSTDSGEPTAPRDSLLLKLARRLGLR